MIRPFATLIPIFLFSLLFALPALSWTAESFKKPSKDELQKRLTKIQFEVTQTDATERPYKNEYWNNKKPGIYVDIVSGEPLFSSLDQYDSGTGWPSFTKPLEPENITTKIDKKLFSVRTEVRSKFANSHLGHVFDDGPAPTGKRYCMNSAAMRFVPAENLVSEGYEKYAALFGIAAASAGIATAKGAPVPAKMQTAILAGGCFWCMEPPFEKLDGVKSVVSGYIGGKKENPTYEEVSAGGTGHVEAVEITFDSNKISYEKILEVFWRQIDPTDNGGQFVDRGDHYKSAMFVNSPEQRKAAEKSKLDLGRTGRFQNPIVTEIRDAGIFYPAEDYHQDYYKKNPVRYKFYRAGSGRDRFLDRVWHDERK